MQKKFQWDEWERAVYLLSQQLAQEHVNAKLREERLLRKARSTDSPIPGEGVRTNQSTHFSVFIFLNFFFF